MNVTSIVDFDRTHLEIINDGVTLYIKKAYVELSINAEDANIIDMRWHWYELNYDSRLLYLDYRIVATPTEASAAALLATVKNYLISQFSVTVNASETVKGIVEEATQAEVNAGTDTGGTGARLFAVPSKIKVLVDSYVTGLWDDRGNFNASVNAYPSSGGSGTAGAILKGDIWTISVAGTLPTGQVVAAGDTVRALVDTPGNTQANWAIAENNIGYVPENVANKDVDGTLAANSDTKYASQKATKTYADALTRSYVLSGGTIFVSVGAAYNPLDATTYFPRNGVPITVNTTAGASRIYFPQAGTIIGCRVVFTQIAGSNETSTFYLRLNNTTDITVINNAVTNDATLTTFSNTGLSQAVAITDYVEPKWITPTWATNPTACVLQWQILVKPN